MYVTFLQCNANQNMINFSNIFHIRRTENIQLGMCSKSQHRTLIKRFLQPLLLGIAIARCFNCSESNNYLERLNSLPKLLI